MSMGPPTAVIDEQESINDSQPATQPLNDSQESDMEDQAFLSQDGKVGSWIYTLRNPSHHNFYCWLF